MRKAERALISVVICFLPELVFAQVPTYIPVQGFITDNNGTPLTGQNNLKFDLYNSSENGTSLFEEIHTIQIDDGFFTIYLGQNVDLDLAVFKENPTVFLELTVNDDQPMSPRLFIGTIPYAAYAEHAGNAETLEGYSALDFRAAAAKIDWFDLENIPSGLSDGDGDTLGEMSCATAQVAKWNGSNWDCGNDNSSSATEAELTGMLDDNYAPLSHNHSTENITSGTLNNDRFSAYSDLEQEGYLDNNNTGDILTQMQADERYINEVFTNSASGLNGGGSSGSINLSVDHRDFYRHQSKYHFAEMEFTGTSSSFADTWYDITSINITIPSTGQVIVTASGDTEWKNASTSNKNGIFGGMLCVVPKETSYYCYGYDGYGSGYFQHMIYNSNQTTFNEVRTWAMNFDFHFSTPGEKTIYVRAFVAEGDTFTFLRTRIQAIFIKE